MPTIPYLYQLQNATYNSLSRTDFKIGVIDPDDSNITTSQLHTLQDQGKTIFSYISIGEAEDYRSYWTDNNWSNAKPSFLLKENPDWPGNYNVKFWDPAWQNTIIQRAEGMARAGYDGMYMDVVDVYTIRQVQQAYGGTSAALRQEMINFVIKLSEHVKAINPDFKVIANNAVDLIGTDANHPNSPNTAYLKAVDGIGKEDTWFYDGNKRPDWTEGDLEFLRTAIANGKFVLAIDYPTTSTYQMEFVTKAAAEGFIPYATTLALNGAIKDADYHAMSLISPDMLARVTGSQGGTSADSTGGSAGEDTLPLPLDAPIALLGGKLNDTLMGLGGNDDLRGNNGNDLISGQGGHDTLEGGSGADTLSGGTSNDTLSGNTNIDLLQGNEGADSMYGGQGSDTLDGGKDNDTLNGNDGNDKLNGGLGNDALYGNVGKDTFVFQKDSGNDTVHDFSRAEGDRLQFTKDVFISRQDALAHTTYANGTATVHMDNGETVTVVNLHENLTLSDFSII